MVVSDISGQRTFPADAVPSHPCIHTSIPSIHLSQPTIHPSFPPTPPVHPPIHPPTHPDLPSQPQPPSVAILVQALCKLIGCLCKLIGSSQPWLGPITTGNCGVNTSAAHVADGSQRQDRWISTSTEEAMDSQCSSARAMRPSKVVRRYWILNCGGHPCQASLATGTASIDKLAAAAAACEPD